MDSPKMKQLSRPQAISGTCGFQVPDLERIFRPRKDALTLPYTTQSLFGSGKTICRRRLFLLLRSFDATLIFGSEIREIMRPPGISPSAGSRVQEADLDTDFS